MFRLFLFPKGSDDNLLDSDGTVIIILCLKSADIQFAKCQILFQSHVAQITHCQFVMHKLIISNYAVYLHIYVCRSFIIFDQF